MPNLEIDFIESDTGNDGEPNPWLLTADQQQEITDAREGGKYGNGVVEVYSTDRGKA